MLSIYTSNMAQNKIIDIESRFRLLLKTGEKFNDNVYTQIMQYIDGVTNRDSDIVENKFGKTLLDDLSTGCKSVMLIIFYRETEYIVSLDECGENALRVLFKLGDKIDIKAFTSSYIKISGDNVRCTINNMICVGGYQIFKRLENLNEHSKV